MSKDTIREQPRPLIVDIDGSLLRTDLFWEGLLIVFLGNPLRIFSFLFKLISGGRAQAKAFIASCGQLDIESMPLSEKALSLIHERKQAGGQVVLASGSHASLVALVGKKCVVDVVFATNNSVNLTGKKKLSFIKEHYKEFDYMGNALVDIPIWKEASQSYVINAGFLTRFYVKRLGLNAVFLVDESLYMKSLSYIRLLRIHQWSKNILLLTPVIASHLFFKLHLSEILLLLTGFFAFSLLASATYIINDLVDLRHDRIHVVKKYRPNASGIISIPVSLSVCAGLFMLVTIMVRTLPIEFTAVLALYLILTLTYSSLLKRLVIIDVVALSLLYTLRIFAGAALMKIEVTNWFVAFSIFVFFSLALVKRCAELLRSDDQKEAIGGRGYVFNDYSQLATLGSSSSMLACLIYCLFISSPEISANYSSPKLLWFGLPLLIYQFSRLWLITNRGKMHTDPVVYIFRDPTSYMTFALFVAVVFVAI